MQNWIINVNCMLLRIDCVYVQGDSLLRRGGSSRGRGRGGYSVSTAGGNIVRLRDKSLPQIEFEQVRIRYIINSL